MVSFFVCAWNHPNVILHFYDIGKLNKQSWSRNSGINTNKICLHRPVSLLKVNNVCDHFHFQCNLHWPIYMYTILQIKLFQMSKTYYSTVLCSKHYYTNLIWWRQIYEVTYQTLNLHQLKTIQYWILV